MLWSPQFRREAFGRQLSPQLLQNLQLLRRPQALHNLHQHPPATAPPQPPTAPPATVPKKRKAKQYEEGDFQYEQPTYGGSLQPVVKRSREWFAIHHPKVKVEREDPFPEARKLSKA